MAKSVTFGRQIAVSPKRYWGSSSMQAVIKHYSKFISLCGTSSECSSCMVHHVVQVDPNRICGRLSPLEQQSTRYNVCPAIICCICSFRLVTNGIPNKFVVMLLVVPAAFVLHSVTCMAQLVIFQVCSVVLIKINE